MTVEELLKPRYKVIADWPEMRDRFKGSPVITLDSKDEEGWFTTNGYYQELFFAMYPHLFKRLEWWEERTKDELPEYIRLLHRDNWLYYKKSDDGGYELPNGFKSVLFLGAGHPITKEEYELNISTKVA